MVQKETFAASKHDKKWRSPADWLQTSGEKIMTDLRLDTATPEEIKRNATNWGLPAEVLEGLVKKYQADRGRDSREREHKGSRESPSDPGTC